MNVDLIVTKLQAEGAQTKIDAIDAIENLTVDEEGLQQLFGMCYLYLLQCYGDRCEVVREQAVGAVTKFIERLPPNEHYMTNVTATLAQQVPDELEDIRLLYVVQLKTLVTRYVSAGMKEFLEPCYVDIVDMLRKALRDSQVLIMREAFACVVMVAGNAQTPKFKPWSEKLSKALCPLLKHQDLRVRKDALRALGQVAVHLNKCSLQRLILELRPVMMDSEPLVRRECGKLGAELLMKLRHRYGYLEIIVPLILCSLKDKSPEVRSYIYPLWIECGRVYYSENKAALIKQDLTAAEPEIFHLKLERPTLGCRGLVLRCLHRVEVIAREASDSNHNVRLLGLKQLYQFALHADAEMTAKFSIVFTKVARTVADEHPEVAAEAKSVAELMGAVFTYQAWCEQGFDYLRRNADLGFLKCFYYMFIASEGVPSEDLLQLSEIFMEAEFMGTKQYDFRKYAIQTVQTCLHKFAELKLGEEQKESDEDITALEQILTTLCMGW